MKLYVQEKNYDDSAPAKGLTVGTKTDGADYTGDALKALQTADAATAPTDWSKFTWDQRPDGSYGFRLWSQPDWYLGVCHKCTWPNAAAGSTPDALVKQAGASVDVKDLSFKVEADTYPFTEPEGTCYKLRHVSDGKLFSRCFGCIGKIVNSVVDKGTTPAGGYDLWCPKRLDGKTFALLSKDMGMRLYVQSTNYDGSAQAKGLTVGTKTSGTATMFGGAALTVLKAADAAMPPTDWSKFTWEVRPDGSYGFRLLSLPGWYLGACHTCKWPNAATGSTPDALVNQGAYVDVKDLSFKVECE